MTHLLKFLATRWTEIQWYGKFLAVSHACIFCWMDNEDLVDEKLAYFLPVVFAELTQSLRFRYSSCQSMLRRAKTSSSRVRTSSSSSPKSRCLSRGEPIGIPCVAIARVAARGHNAEGGRIILHLRTKHGVLPIPIPHFVPGNIFLTVPLVPMTLPNRPRRSPGGVCYAHNGPNLLVVWVDNQPIGVHI